MSDSLPIPATAREDNFSLIHAELRKLARSAMSRERPDHTLQPTALVNEAYLRLTRGNPGRWDSRGHFFSAAAQAMREILVEHARMRNAAKRATSGERVEFDEAQASFESH